MKTNESKAMCNLNNKLSMNETVKSLCDTAKTGLARFYPQTSEILPYSATLNSSNKWQVTGNSLRYASISQIGIAAWLKTHPEDSLCLPDLWPRIINNADQITQISNIALVLWAGVECQEDTNGVIMEMLPKSWESQKKSCNSVELAWVVQALIRLSQITHLNKELMNVLEDAWQRLMVLYSEHARLFARHNRAGIRETISKRVACFADQVYPILALAHYGKKFDNERSIKAAVSVADRICELQGDKGQWWWHYDMAEGKVCEGYPVFSVHQDGMAPMALLAIDKVAGTNHRPYIEKGLTWLNKCNELGRTMIVPEEGIIWRDIHRREFSKIYRIARGALLSAGWHKMHRLAGTNLFGYVVNKECRPYHLGWLLYAWADYNSN